MSRSRLHDVVVGVVISVFIVLALVERHVYGDQPAATWHLLVAATLLLLEMDIRHRRGGRP